MSAEKPPFLEHVRMERFGRFHDRAVGPFGRHLNIVFGPNESGKTTLASFVAGVLFGWEEARGNRNTYKPAGADRAGALFYSDGRVLSRARNADGLQGSVELVEDIDRDTFRTMFFLNSDELRSLRNTTDTTAKLLTAGSGTSSSPAHALAHLNERLAGFTSRAAAAEQSIPRLLEERNALREKQKVASEEADRWRSQDRELHELEPERAAMAERVEESNRMIEALSSARTAVEALEAEQGKLAREEERLAETERAAEAELKRLEQSVGSRLASLTASEDRSLRDRLDALASQQARLSHGTDVARTNYTSSAAVYEALLETVSEEDDQIHARSKRRIQMAFCIVLPAVLFLLGVPLFIEGRDHGSLSYLAIGFLLSVFAAILVVAGFIVLFRPNKEDASRKQRFDDAHWVMVQDKKKMEACQAEEEQFSFRVAQELADVGLGAAEGSIRQARGLLDEARDVRSDMALCRQRQQSAAARRTQGRQRLAEIASERAAAIERAGLSSAASLGDIEQEYERRLLQRTGLLETFEAMNHRAGELASILAHGEAAEDFDRCKIAVQQASTRLDEAKADFARLLLAKRMLEAAIATWESKSQPEVYARASRLLSLMTDGRWTEVSLTPEGTLQVIDAVKTVRSPVHLSLGTCQQLYLALRIALLTSADNVGRSIPILADDILVNFDERRRIGAARALVELAESRQVILFTCHEGVLRALKKAAKQSGRPATVIEL